MLIWWVMAGWILNFQYCKWVLNFYIISSMLNKAFYSILLRNTFQIVVVCSGVSILPQKHHPLIFTKLTPLLICKLYKHPF